MICFDWSNWIFISMVMVYHYFANIFLLLWIYLSILFYKYKKKELYSFPENIFIVVKTCECLAYFTFLYYIFCVNFLKYFKIYYYFSFIVLSLFYLHYNYSFPTRNVSNTDHFQNISEKYRWNYLGMLKRFSQN